MSLTPSHLFRNQIYVLLKDNFHIPVNLNKPKTGADIPSIELRKVLDSKAFGYLGDRTTSTKLGEYRNIRLQIDIFEKESVKAETIADQVATIIFKNKAVLKSKGVINPNLVNDFEMPPEEKGQRWIQRVMEFEANIKREYVS